MYFAASTRVLCGKYSSALRRVRWPPLQGTASHRTGANSIVGMPHNARQRQGVCNKDPLTRFLSSPSLPASGKKSIFVGKSVNTHMNIFDDYKDHKGEYAVSPSLLWEYDLSAFDWWKSRKTVVARILERGWLKDYFAAFDLYGGIEGFRNIIKEIPYLPSREIDFACIAFGLKKEELKCYTRKRLREQLLNS